MSYFLTIIFGVFIIVNTVIDIIDLDITNSIDNFSIIPYYMSDIIFIWSIIAVIMQFIYIFSHL